MASSPIGSRRSPGRASASAGAGIACIRTGQPGVAPIHERRVVGRHRDARAARGEREAAPLRLGEVDDPRERRSAVRSAFRCCQRQSRHSASVTPGKRSARAAWRSPRKLAARIPRSQTRRVRGRTAPVFADVTARRRGEDAPLGAVPSGTSSALPERAMANDPLVAAGRRERRRARAGPTRRRSSPPAPAGRRHPPGRRPSGPASRRARGRSGGTSRTRSGTTGTGSSASGSPGSTARAGDPASRRTSGARSVETDAEFHMGITPYYAALMDPEDPTCPIRLQSVPTMGELNILSSDLEDPLAEERDMPVPGITHRYPDRVLFYTTHNCPVYCRHCTRKRKVSDPTSAAAKRQIEELARVHRAARRDPRRGDLRRRPALALGRAARLHPRPAPGDPARRDLPAGHAEPRHAPAARDRRLRAHAPAAPPGLRQHALQPSEGVHRRGVRRGPPPRRRGLRHRQPDGAAQGRERRSDGS